MDILLKVSTGASVGAAPEHTVSTSRGSSADVEASIASGKEDLCDNAVAYLNEVAYWPGTPLGQATEMLIMRKLLYGHGVNYDIGFYNFRHGRCWARLREAGKTARNREGDEHYRAPVKEDLMEACNVLETNLAHIGPIDASLAHNRDGA